MWLKQNQVEEGLFSCYDPQVAVGLCADECLLDGKHSDVLLWN